MLRGRAVPGERRAGHCADGQTEERAKAVQTQTAPPFPVPRRQGRSRCARAISVQRPITAPGGRCCAQSSAGGQVGAPPSFAQLPRGQRDANPAPSPPRERGSSSRPTHRRGRTAGANGAGAHFHTVRPGPARPCGAQWPRRRAGMEASLGAPRPA